MMWKTIAAIGAAAGTHLGTQMMARNQKNAAYAGDVNISQTLGENTTANLNNSPYFEMLAQRANYSNQAQYLNQLEQANPGYSAWSSSQSNTAQQYARGEVSQDTLANIQRRAYERSTTLGITGQAADYRFVKDVGRTQLQNAMTSQSIMQQLTALNKVNMTGVGSFYSSPQEAFRTAIMNRENQQAYLNAKQAAENSRKNAIWAALVSGSVAYANQMGGKQATSEQTQWQSYDTAFMNNQYA